MRLREAARDERMGSARMARGLGARVRIRGRRSAFEPPTLRFEAEGKPRYFSAYLFGSLYYQRLSDVATKGYAGFVFEPAQRAERRD